VAWGQAQAPGPADRGGYAVPSIPDHELGLVQAIAAAEEAIGRCEQAVTRQLRLIEALPAGSRGADRARELLRVAEEHLAERHATRRRLLDASAG
jgi:hypothetical protein